MQSFKTTGAWDYETQRHNILKACLHAVLGNDLLIVLQMEPMKRVAMYMWLGIIQIVPKGKMMNHIWGVILFSKSDKMFVKTY